MIAARIELGCVAMKCQTGNCNNTVWVSVWRKPGKYHCDTCRAMMFDDLEPLNCERDVEEEETDE